MDDDTSITRWVRGVEQGDTDAVERLWEYCFPPLVRFARDKLRRVPQRVASGEDLALSTMDSFFRAAEQGKFHQLADRSDLLRLLLRMTSRKAVDLIRQETSQRRGGGHVRGNSALDHLDRRFGPGVQGLPDPTPELAAVFTDEIRRLLDLLGNPDLQAIAVARMEGSHNDEIARDLNCSVRTIERGLEVIRTLWEEECSS